MKTIYLIRHAKTQGNLERRYIGRIDESLCEEGLKALHAASESGRYPDCGLLFVSPMKRCMETAGVIYPSKPYAVVEDLRECDFGAFEGKTYSELKDDPSYCAFLDSGGSGDIPDGESVSAMKQRCCRAFLNIIRQMEAEGCETASVVCHGGTIMAILEQFSGEQNSFYDYQIENCGVYLCVSDTETQRFTTIEKR